MKFFQALICVLIFPFTFYGILVLSALCVMPLVDWSYAAAIQNILGGGGGIPVIFLLVISFCVGGYLSATYEADCKRKNKV